MRSGTIAIAAALAVGIASPAWPAEPTQGIAADQVLIGSILDLSGPLAGLGKQIRLGMTMRSDEINAQGGVNGRKLKIVFEDSAYDPKKAVLAAEKLVGSDQVFAVAGSVGTAINLAAMPVQFEKGVLNFFPVTAAVQMYEPFDRLKYAFAPSYLESTRVAVASLVKEKSARRVCILYQDDDFGQEVLHGVEAGLKPAGLSLVERTTYKRGATDFSSQMARLQAARCDLMVLGTVVRETVGAMTAAKKIGFEPVVLTNAGAYMEAVPRLGGAAVNGLYASMTEQIPYADDPSEAIRAWVARFKAKHREDPDTFSVAGYQIIDTFAKALAQAGPGPTTDSFIRAMDGMTVPANLFGGPELRFSPTQHLGNNRTRLSQIVDGRWKVVSGYPQ